MRQDYEEKRDFPRMRLNCAATFTEPGTGERFTQMVLNLSGGGMLFLSNKPYAPGAELEVQVDPGTGLTPPLRARISVLRVEARGDGREGYRVAAVIEQILSEGRRGSDDGDG